MTREELVKRNLDLHAEWMRYVFDNTDVLDRFPKGATLVILPEDDPELSADNAKAIDASRAKGFPVVVVRMKSPKPRISTIEVVAA